MNTNIFIETIKNFEKIKTENLHLKKLVISLRVQIKKLEKNNKILSRKIESETKEKNEEKFISEFEKHPSTFLNVDLTKILETRLVDSYFYFIEHILWGKKYKPNFNTLSHLFNTSDKDLLKMTGFTTKKIKLIRELEIMIKNDCLDNKKLYEIMMSM